jgi:hypothetical protein
MFNDVALRVRALAWTGSLQTWRLMHDVYSIQHEEEYCGRYRALAMHLGGVCWALEHNASERGYRALQKFIETDPWKDEPYPPAPGIPASRGPVHGRRAEGSRLGAAPLKWRRQVGEVGMAGLQGPAANRHGSGWFRRWSNDTNDANDGNARRYGLLAASAVTFQT